MNEVEKKEHLLYASTAIISGLLSSGAYTRPGDDENQPLIWTNLVPNAVEIAKQLIALVDQEVASGEINGDN